MIFIVDFLRWDVVKITDVDTYGDYITGVNNEGLKQTFNIKFALPTNRIIKTLYENHDFSER